MKDIALALGGGGVKGHAHIGVIRVLEREGFHIRAIAGTSAGGLWGSLAAFGYSPEDIKRLFTSIDSENVYTRKPGDGPAWFGLTGVRQMLADSLGDSNFEDLRLPFAVTAVDINTGEHLALRKGCVMDAVMATIAMPGFFPPVDLDGRTLIDGGVLDPVPISLARALAPSLPVVAVVLSPPVDAWKGYQKPILFNSLPLISEYVGRTRFSQALNIYLRSIDIAGAMLTELLLQVEKPEVIIRPEVPEIGLFDPVDIDAIMKMGEQAAECALQDLDKAVSWKAQVSRRIFPNSQKQIHPPYTDDFNCK